MAFHEVRFPVRIALGSRGGPRRRTVISAAGSGHEHRNSQWADSKREYNAGYGVKSISDIYTVVEFFEERRGRLHGFRWKDAFDYTSADPEDATTPFDQPLGTANGSRTEFQLIKKYGSLYAPYTRDILKPVAGTVKVAVDGVQATTGWTVSTLGVITFSSPPASGIVSAGFEFDVPVRFDTDYLEVNLTNFEAGQIPDIPIVEIRL